MHESHGNQSGNTPFYSPKIYILSDPQTDIAFLQARLETLGYKIVGSGRMSEDFAPDFKAVPDFVLCAVDSISKQCQSIITAIKAACAPKPICLVGLMGRQNTNAPGLFDTVLFQPAHPVQIHNRMNALTRLKRMEKALTLRRETLVSDFSVGCKSETHLSGMPFRILFVGTASPEFMAILNALQEKNVEVLAAFTSFTAFDYLHERDFDAVVLNATDSLEPTLSVSDTMRNNARFFNIPTLLMTREDQAEAGDIALAKGARDVFFAGASSYEICGRILELANFYRIHSFLRSELAKVDQTACLDDGTGLYNRDFLHAHMRRVADDSAKIGETIALLMLRIRPRAMDTVEPHIISQALNRMGSTIKKLVRAEDITSRVSEDIFAVAFPGQTKAMAGVVGMRIKEIVDNTAFPTGSKGVPLTLEAEILLSEKMNHEDTDHFINRTETELLGGPSEKLVAY